MAAKAKVKLLPTWLAKVILTALIFVESKLLEANGLPEIVVSAMHLQLRPIRLSIEAISDTNPQNAEQVKQIWADHVGTEMVNFGNQVTEGPIAQVGNEGIRHTLQYLAPKVFHMGRLLTDDNPANAAQLEQHWGAVMRDDEFHELVLSYLLGPSLEKILDPVMTAFVLELINTALDQWLEGGDNANTLQAIKTPALSEARIRSIKKKLAVAIEEKKALAA